MQNMVKSFQISSLRNITVNQTETETHANFHLKGDIIGFTNVKTFFKKIHLNL